MTTADAQPQIATEFGQIDADTPLGRRFRFIVAKGARDPRTGKKAKTDQEYSLTLRAFASDEIVAESNDCSQAVIASPNGWARDFAPFCACFTDPTLADEAAEAPVAEVPPAPPAEATAPDLVAGRRIPQELLDDLASCRNDLIEAEKQEDDAKEAHKSAKQCVEDCQARLSLAVGQIVNLPQTPTDAPLFDVANYAGAEAERAAGIADAEHDVRGQGPAQPAWKAVRLDSLQSPGIAARYLKALAENTPPITTMGDLAAWQEMKGDFWAKDITGIGEAGQNELVNATTAYWERRKVAQLARAGLDKAKETIPCAAYIPGPCDGMCGWEGLSARIGALLADERYAFAADTLVGILDWVNEHEHATEAQKQAVGNIAASVND